MSDFKSLKDILQQKEQKDTGKFISREFQDYGYRLAIELSDLKHKSLYIKLAKNYPRTLLEEAKSYVLDYPNAKKKGAIFMWKLREMQNKEIPDKNISGKKVLKPRTEKLF